MKSTNTHTHAHTHTHTFEYMAERNIFLWHVLGHVLGYIALSGLVDSTSFWGGKCAAKEANAKDEDEDEEVLLRPYTITKKNEGKKERRTKKKKNKKNIRIIARNGVECLESSHRKLISFRGLAPGSQTSQYRRPRDPRAIFLHLFRAVVKQNLSMIGLLFAHIYLNADFIYVGPGNGGL